MARERRQHVAPNVASLSASLLDMVMDPNLNMPPRCCIFLTPKILRRHNEKAYAPNAFSIGPFHHTDQSLKATEKLKVKYLQALIRRSCSNPEQKLDEIVKGIGEIEREARECYAPKDCLPNEYEFAKIMVLDGCFIIELFLRHTYGELRDLEDPVFNMSCMLQFLHHDLCLLENQIPWLVLERLFAMTSSYGSLPLVALALKFFATTFQSEPLPTDKREDWPNENKHILDLLRTLLIRRSTRLDEDTLGLHPVPSARILEEAGIKFQRVNSSCILDIKLRNDHVLEIPPLLIQETTEVVFRNLISYEQCLPGCRPVITSYAILFNNLIKTAKDVNILIEKGIIHNWLNLEDATQFFNKLYLDTYIKEYFYFQLSREINLHCCSPRAKLRTFMVRNYLYTPMGIISQIAAVVLNICGIIQAVCAIVKK